MQYVLDAIVLVYLIAALYLADSSSQLPRPVGMDPARLNLVTAGCRGCYIVDVVTPWLLGVETASLAKTARASLQQAAKQQSNFDNNFVEELVPLSLLELNTNDCVLAIENFSVVPRVAFISASSQHADDLMLYDVNQQQLTHGLTSNSSLPKRRRQKKTKKKLEEPSALVIKPTDLQIPCITFIVIVPPLTCLLLARLLTRPSRPDPPDLFKLSFPLLPHPDPEGKSQPFVPRLVFPLPIFDDDGSNDTPSAYLCTQGMGGRLTHFFPESFHAVDFRCPEGTPLLAVADGVIIEIEQKNSARGIHCLNLGSWNSLSLAVDDTCNPHFVPSTFSSSSASPCLPPSASSSTCVASLDSSSASEVSSSTIASLSKNAKRKKKKKKEEAASLARLGLASLSVSSVSSTLPPCGLFTVDYVHIQAGSARVKVGDRVKAGDVICLSGSVGFAPEPHVHIEMHLTADRKGASTKFTFGDASAYVPMAGSFYPPCVLEHSPS